MRRYQTPHALAPEAGAVIGDTLETVAREGARRLLEHALRAEVDDHLGRVHYERGPAFSGYRNGYARPREIGIGTWSVGVRAPRVRDTPPGAPPFESAILPKRRYLSLSTQRLFARLYLEGLSSGDFEPAFRELLGERAPLSASTIIRLKAIWEAEYETWRGRPITDRYAYIWADGIYLGAGLEAESSCLLVVIGARADGAKELLALELGYRESTESWATVLRSLREGGLAAPLVAVGDGALGLWAALRAVYPTTRHQRCWNHRAMNLADKLPKRLQAEFRDRFRALYLAPTRVACEAARDDLAVWLHERSQDSAAETLMRDWDDFTTFFDFPAEHWLHLRTSNPIESVFAGVRLRTNVAKRARVRENALYLVFKIVERLGRHWRVLNGGPTVMTIVLAGGRFSDGVLVQSPPREEVQAA